MVQKIFSHYRKPIFDLLNEEFDNFILLTTKYKHSVSPDTDFLPSYVKLIGYFKYGKNETNFILDTFTFIFRMKPDVIIYEFSLGILSLIPTMILCKILNIKFILHGHGYNFKKGLDPKKNILDKVRIRLIEKSDATILYSKTAKTKLSTFIQSEKLFVAPNTLDTNYLLSIKEKFLKQGKESLKSELNFSKKFNIVFIGRLLEDKQPFLCINFIEDYIKKYNKDIMLHIVGEGPEKNKLVKFMNDNKLSENIRLYGKIYDDIKSGKILFCSDLLILPGAVGLSVNHALIYGCPVMSLKQKSDGPFHSPEVEYIENEKTGFLADDYVHLKNFIFKYLNDKSLQLKMQNEINFAVQNTFPIEKMIDGFKSAVLEVLRDKRNI